MKAKFTLLQNKKRAVFAFKGGKGSGFYDHPGGKGGKGNPGGSQSNGEGATNQAEWERLQTSRYNSIISSLKNKLGIPQSAQVKFSSAFRYSTLPDGTDVMVAGDFNTSTHSITLYTDPRDESESSEILLHEYSHMMVQSVMDKSNTVSLQKIFQDEKLFASTPKFSSYAAKYWEGNDMTLSIKETVAEAYRYMKSGRANDIPAGWQKYTHEIERLYANLS